jgi:hypothetical protein
VIGKEWSAMTVSNLQIEGLRTAIAPINNGAQVRQS